MKIAFVYGGQGAQVVGMGRDYYDNEPTAKAYYDNLTLDADVKKYAFEGSLEEITQTEITQIVIVAYQIMVTNLLKEKNIVPSSTLGLSIGEYSALYAASVLSEQETLKTAEMRGRFMGEVKADTAMYAILKADEAEIQAALDEANKESEKWAYIANYNCPGQIVISGDSNACQKAAEILATAKKKAIKLNVSSAFHTPFMQPAAEKFEKFLQNITFNAPKIPVFTNVTGNKEVVTREMMVDQMRKSVRLEDAMRHLIAEGVDMIVEIGYNNTIKNFIKRINRKVKVITISDYESFNKALGELKNAQ